MQMLEFSLKTITLMSENQQFFFMESSNLNKCCLIYKINMYLFYSLRICWAFSDDFCLFFFFFFFFFGSVDSSSLSISTNSV